MKPLTLGWDTATWCLAAGADVGSEESVKKMAVERWRNYCAPFEWVRFMHPGYGQWKETWHNPKVDEWVCEALIGEGVKVLWCLTNRDSFADSTERATTTNGWLWPAPHVSALHQIAGDITRFPQQVMFEKTNGDTVADGISLNQVRSLVKVPLRRVLTSCGAFFYDWRRGDCGLQSFGSRRVVSEFGISLKKDSHLVDERLGQMIGYMKGVGVKIAFWHEPCSRGYQYDEKAWELAPAEEAALPHYELGVYNQKMLRGTHALAHRLAGWGQE